MDTGRKTAKTKQSAGKNQHSVIQTIENARPFYVLGLLQTQCSEVEKPAKSIVFPSIVPAV
jgi:hypothetical protein